MEFKYLFILDNFETQIIKRELTADEEQNCIDCYLGIINLLNDTEFITDGDTAEWMPIEIGD